MAAPKRITPDMLPGMLKLAGEGKSAGEIAAWILTEHKVKVSDRAIRQHMEKVRAERRPIAQAVVQEKLSKTLTTDLDAVDDLLRRARKLEDLAKKTDDIAGELDLIGQSDIGDYFDELGAAKALMDIPAEKRRAIASLEVETTSLRPRRTDDGCGEIEEHSAGKVIKIRLWDKVAALKEATKLRAGTAEITNTLAAMAGQMRALELRFKLSGATDDPEKDKKPRGLVLLPAITPDE